MDAGMLAGLKTGAQGAGAGFSVPLGYGGMYGAGTGARDPMEACAVRAATGAVMGGLMGSAMGIVLGGYGSIAPPITIPGVPDPPKVPMKWQLRDSWLSTARRGRRWGKNFAFVTVVFSGIECCIEKYRAKHDIVNGVSAGCATGAAMAASQGPFAACVGCVGFAAFSAAIESVMGH